MKSKKTGWTYPCEIKKIVSGEYRVVPKKSDILGFSCDCGDCPKPVKVEVIVKRVVNRVNI